MKSAVRLLPVLYSAILFLLIRVANDVSRSSSYFASHSLLFVAVELVCVAAAGYLSFAGSRRWASRSMSAGTHPVVEYGVIVVATVMACAAIMGISHLGQPLGEFARDLAVPVVVATLMQLCLYIFIKWTMVSGRLQRQRLLNQRIRARRLSLELEALRAQFHPHFLFNMLNTVYFAISPDNTVARDAVADLAGLMRSQLHGSTDSVPLSGEAEVIRSYVGLSRLRLSDDAEVRLDIGIMPQDAMVKPFMLLPLVENAFKHCGYPPRIDISLVCKDGWLTLSVANNLSTTPADGSHGIGLSALRRRLELIYPSRHSFDISFTPTQCLTTLSIPVSQTAV